MQNRDLERSAGDEDLAHRAKHVSPFAFRKMGLPEQASIIGFLENLPVEAVLPDEADARTDVWTELARRGRIEREWERIIAEGAQDVVCGGFPALPAPHGASQAALRARAREQTEKNRFSIAVLMMSGGNNPRGLGWGENGEGLCDEIMADPERAVMTVIKDGFIDPVCAEDVLQGLLVFCAVSAAA